MMHFVNASQIGPRKFIGTLGNQKNPEIRSPLKARKPRVPPTEGCCTRAVAMFHIVVHISLILIFLVVLLILSLNGKSAEDEINNNPDKYGKFLWNFNKAGIKAVIILFAFGLAGSILGLLMSIVLLKGEKERSIFKLKLWIVYTLIVCCSCILFPCYIWKLNDGPLWAYQGKILIFIVLFIIEIIFLWIVTAYIRKIQTTPVPAPDALISDV
ncbi:unnamed protein product [Allacma fusca]|uniref:Uncharacterized protein n=1 Tax=Allacma fusca TaxID=39272 RepID=A0A8J2JJF7_9HEXA|nr:unnamed protein product [Allacma fusca]